MSEKRAARGVLSPVSQNDVDRVKVATGDGFAQGRVQAKHTGRTSSKLLQ